MIMITDEELRSQGNTVFDNTLKGNEKVSVTIEGKDKYILLSQEYYKFLRECEIESAIYESQQNMKKGEFVIETIDKHLAKVLANV